MGFDLWYLMILGGVQTKTYGWDQKVSKSQSQPENQCVCNRYHIATEKQPLNQLKRLPKCYFLTNSFAEGFEEINHLTGGIQT
jgi:hypothetical protein